MSDGAAREKKANLWTRDELDWYVEPPAATEALLNVERFVGGIWDPACGQGNIVTALLNAGYQAYGSDIEDRCARASWFRGKFNFLLHETTLVEPNIVTNPPFFRAKGAEEFIRRALTIATGKVAAFVDIRFLAGAERANGLFADHPPTRIWIVTPRVSCPPGSYLAAGNKAGNGSSDWCWLVFDRTAPPASFPQLGWLRSGKSDRECAR